MRRGRAQGFTLVELLVVIVVIGILATLALPQYTSVMERSRQREAVVNLNVIRGSQMRYALDNNNNYATDFTVLDIENLSTGAKYFNYSVSGAIAAELAKATRNTVQNSYGTYNISIDVNGTLNISGGSNPPQP